MLQVAEIVVWIAAVLFAIAWGFLIRGKAKAEQATEHVFELFGLLLAGSAVVVPAISISALHLLWIVPASFILSLASIVFPLNLLWIPASLYAQLWYVGARNPALALYRSGEYAKAIDAFEKAIQERPKSAENHFYLGLAYSKLEDHESAIGALQECIRLNPGSPEAHCNLGFSFKDSGDFTSAIEAFSNAIRLRPTYTRAIFNLALCYVEVGDIQSALKQHAALQALDNAEADNLMEVLRRES